MKKNPPASFFVKTKKSGISLECFLIESQEVAFTTRNDHFLSLTPFKFKK